MSLRANGSYIGPRPAGPSSSVASGIWSLAAAERQRRASAWPQPAPPFLPSDITGLQLWLDASDASTLYDATSGGSLVAADGGVARWEDKSGNARHATQSTSANRPTRKAAIQNGRDAIQLDGSNDVLTVSYTYGSQVSLFMVTSRAANTERYLFGGSNQSGTPAIISQYSSKAFEWFNDPDRFTIQTTSTGVNLVVVTQQDSVAVTGYYNGTQSATSSPSASISGKTLSFLGAANATQAQAQITLCELVVYNSVLSSQDRQSVETYLMTKWGIS
jgi:hypothetical protein